MTKEEYLANYKEEKLAELCVEFEESFNITKEQLDTTNKKYVETLTEYHNAEKELNKYKEIVSDPNKLFHMLNNGSADTFIKLYHLMSSAIYMNYNSLSNLNIAKY